MKNFSKTERNKYDSIYHDLSYEFNCSHKNINDEQDQNIDQDIILNVKELPSNKHIDNSIKSLIKCKSDIIPSYQNIEFENINNNLEYYPDNTREQIEKTKIENIETKTEESHMENVDINNYQNKKEENDKKLENIKEINIPVDNIETHKEKLNKNNFCKCFKKVCKIILYILIFVICFFVIIIIICGGGGNINNFNNCHCTDCSDCKCNCCCRCFKKNKKQINQ